MSIVAQKITYIHPDNQVLFKGIDLTINKGQKVALVGNNGSGKSTFLRILAGTLQAQEGKIIHPTPPYYVPQHFGQYDNLTVAQALRIDGKLEALRAITDGDASLSNFNTLADDWTIEERSLAALHAWGLEHILLSQPMRTLSGGEKTKVFLSGIEIHQPSILLLDEPTNHLDRRSREKLYDFITSCRITLLVVSHDRTLLNLLASIAELSVGGITLYGGNYDFYKEQKEQEQASMQEKLEAKEKELRRVRKTAREVAERKQKHESRGEKQSVRKGIPRIMMGGLKENAEKSASKLKEVHEDKMENLANELKQMLSSLPDLQGMKLDFSASGLHEGKILVTAKEINFGYAEAGDLWPSPISFQIKSGERWLIQGDNGSGKTTLLKLITGQLPPRSGSLIRADFSSIYIDQEYSIVRNGRTVYEQAQAFNERHFQEHEIKTLLNRFLFPHDTWEKSCGKLSGGEKMRLAFCCLMISNQTPDLFILDEPTNNLDIQSIEIITSMVRAYRGTILLISHDAYFIRELGIHQIITTFAGRLKTNL